MQHYRKFAKRCVDAYDIRSKANLAEVLSRGE